MKYICKKQIVLFFIFIAYVTWSQVYINHLSNSIPIEKERALNIARHLELWKNITVNYDRYLEPLLQENKKIRIVKIERDKSELGIKKNENMYSMYHLDSVDENALQKYVSDSVLDGYFYIITDSDGKIQDLFWDST